MYTNLKRIEGIKMEDVFNLDESKSGSYLADRKQNDDGLLRPKLEEGKDGVRQLVIRLLPNLTKEGKIGPTAIEKHIHYANFKNNPKLKGYYDCLKNTTIGKECPLCATYWNLKNSNNPTDQDKSKLINRSTKYYAYALVVEDQQVPENEGKIFIFPFGYKIYQKIKMKAESTRKPCKVEDLVHGANLNLVIEEVGGYYNYDASSFEAPEPIEIDGKMLEVGEDGKISKAEKSRVIEFLNSREHDLEKFAPVEWTTEQYEKVDQIIALLSGQQISTSSAPTPSASNAPVAAASDIFEDEDETPEPEPAPKKTRAKKTTPVVKESDDVEPTISDAKKKAAAFFDDDDD